MNPTMTPPPSLEPPDPPTGENGVPYFGFLGNPKVTVALYLASVIAYGMQFAGAFGVELPKNVTGSIALAAFVLGLINHQVNARRTTPKAMIALTVGAALFTAHAAFAAAPALSVGPSFPAVAITPGETHPVSLAPGAGVALGADFFPTTLLGRQVHALTLGGDFFGALLPNGKSIAANVSVALHVALYELVSLGVGLKLYDTGGFGVLNGAFTGHSLFVLLGIDYGLINALVLGHSGTAPAE
jgi:hypothetical protein